MDNTEAIPDNGSGEADAMPPGGRLSLLAVFAFVLALGTAIIPILQYFGFDVYKAMPDDQARTVAVVSFAGFFCIPIVGGFALAAIRKSGGRLWGRPAAIWAVMAWPIVGLLVLAGYFGTGENLVESGVTWALIAGLVILLYSLFDVVSEPKGMAAKDEESVGYFNAAIRGFVILIAFWMILGNGPLERFSLKILLVALWFTCLYALYNSARGCLLRYKYLGYLAAACGAIVLVLGGVILVRGI